MPACRYIPLLLCLLMLLTNCRTTSNSYRDVQLKTDSRPVEERFKTVTDGYKAWNTFSAKGKFSIAGDEELAASMQLRAVNGEYIYISLRGAMGIEGGKIFISPDSLYIVDKINKCYIADVVSTFTAGIDISLSQLQNLIIGRCFGTDDAALSEITDTGNFMASTANDNGCLYHFIFDSHNLLSAMVASNDADYATCSAGFDSHVETSNGIVPASWAIVSRLDGAQVTMQAEYSPSSITWDRQLNDKFTINANFKKIDAHQLLSQLGDEL